MPIASKYHADFCEGNVYHVYNRTNNKELLFRSDENRNYFLRQFHRYLNHLTETFCWCLLDNHFHLLVRVNSLTKIHQNLQEIDFDSLTVTEKKFLDNDCTLSELIEVAFKNFFQSYTLAFNKQHHRKGNLFYKPFKRLLVDKESQFTQAVIYIHANPVKHLIASNFQCYKWSSYQSFLSDLATKVLKNEVLEWFGAKKILKIHIRKWQHIITLI